MRIAVTGATGLLGRYLVERFAAAGHVCRCWHRSSSDRGGFGASANKLEWLPGELGDQKATAALVAGCDAVVHSGLYLPGDRFQGGEGDLLTFVDRNVLGTLALIEAARAASVGRFIFISSCAVHDQILDDRPLNETHPTWAKSHYGAHKAAIEQFVYSFGLGEGYPICALRPTAIYGLAYPPQQSTWFDLVRQVATGQSVECRGGGKQVHAVDVARAAELLLTADGIAGQAYQCCDRYISQFEVATLAKEISGSMSEISGEPSRPKHEIDTTKIRALGMTFGGQELLRATIKQLVDATRR
jgi:nucleoside-diphosphate-sugar epimerase